MIIGAPPRKVDIKVIGGSTCNRVPKMAAPFLGNNPPTSRFNVLSR